MRVLWALTQGGLMAVVLLVLLGVTPWFFLLLALPLIAIGFTEAYRPPDF